MNTSNNNSCLSQHDWEADADFTAHIMELYDKSDEENTDRKLIVRLGPLDLKAIADKYLGYLRDTCWYVYGKVAFGCRYVVSTVDSKLREHYNEPNYDILDCYVCMRNKRDKVLIACGHTICNNCYDQILINCKECPVCRTRINGSIDFYL